MVKYRRKPLIVEAVQWNGEDRSDISTNCNGCTGPQIHLCDENFDCHNKYLLRYSQTESNYICPGDYILTYLDGTIEVKTQAEMDRDWEKVENKCSNCGGTGIVNHYFRVGKWLAENTCRICHGTGKVEE